MLHAAFLQERSQVPTAACRREADADADAETETEPGRGAETGIGAEA